MNKYRNKKTSFDGIKFDSQKEAKRYAQLKLLERGKAIGDLRLQVPFVLIPSQNGGLRNELPVRYIADFVYIENGKQVIEDTKGFKTPDYVIKRKLMKQAGYEITEI